MHRMKTSECNIIAIIISFLMLNNMYDEVLYLYVVAACMHIHLCSQFLLCLQSICFYLILKLDMVIKTLCFNN